LKFKWFLIWTLLHTISILVVTFLIDLIYVRSPFLELLLLGFGVTILANIYRTFTRKKKFIINSFFAFWIAVNSITIWLFALISNGLNVNDIYLNAIIIGIGLVGTSYLVHALHVFRLRRLKIWIPTLIILGILFFAHGGLTIMDSQEISKNTSVSSGNFIENFVDSIKESFSKNLVTSCPQIDVPIGDSWGGLPIGNSWGGLSISGQSYDGWTIKGDATCRKGTKEGENLNQYYCGGYRNTLGIGFVNAYIEKTIISEDGEIGKTYKYVIWNIYDENKDFVETRCIGNPDEFEQKQYEAFEREMLKWN